MVARPQLKPLDALYDAVPMLTLGLRSAIHDLKLSRELAGARREIEAVHAQLDEALERDGHLTRRVILLEAALAGAEKRGYRDELTGLANRRLLLEHYRHAAARAARRHTQLALVFLDLDDFKGINSSLGHSGGDKLLQGVAERLTKCIRPSDTACRFGGDEFAILLPELERNMAMASANRIRADIAKPFFVNGTVITMTTSVGIAVYPFDGEQCDDLLRVADREMYRDKAIAARHGASSAAMRGGAGG